MNKELAIVSAVIAMSFLFILGMFFHYNNQEKRLHVQIEAQRGKIEGVHDKMWKVITQKAEVSADYRASFDSIYVGIMQGRYSDGGGGLMKWITESNPEFDTSLYKDLMQSIELLRTEFQKAQERIIDLIRERKTLIEVYPSCWFVQDKSEIEYTIISSTRSKTVMETGIDDEVRLF